MNKFLILIIFFLGISPLAAQSDYEIVQSFKKQSKLIEEEILNTDSPDALNDIEREISRLKSEFVPHKSLINGGLYPNSFESTLDDLNNAYNNKKNNFMQLFIVQTEAEEQKEEVKKLKMKVDTLTERNNELARRFKILEQQNENQVAQLKKTVFELRASLQKRDKVVLEMIDKIFPSNYKDDDELSPREKHRLVSEAEEQNVLAHLKRVINDNIKFLEATKLYPEDIADLRSRQQNFMRLWKGIDTTMIELYAEKGKSTAELKEINTAFARWDSKLNSEVWNSINDEFAKNKIQLQNFSTGRQFTSVVVNFIDDEIRNAGKRGNTGAEATYINFTENTWNNEIRPNWVPFLIDNNLLAAEQKDTIEVMIASWKNTVYPDGLTWLYVILGVFAVAIILFYISKKSKQFKQRGIVKEQNPTP